MCVEVALLITQSSFYREGQGSFLSSPKSHGEHGMCSLDLWTENSKAKRGTLSTMCPDEAGVGHEAQTCPWNRGDPP